MIYLIAQMFVTLVLAGILGAAIGWLVHRASYARKLDEYRHALARAHSQVAQTESEVTMLTDDYDELHRRSKAEINNLRSENQQIPFLNTNLEKSQLLVRQMMQKHEAKVRDLSSENQALTSKLKTIQDREQAYNKVKVELDSIRRQKVRDAQQKRTDSVQTDTVDEEHLNASAELEYDHSDDSSDDVADDVSHDDSMEILDATIASNPAEEFINNLKEATKLPESDSSWASSPIEIDADSTQDNLTPDFDVEDESENPDLVAEDESAADDEDEVEWLEASELDEADWDESSEDTVAEDSDEIEDEADWEEVAEDSDAEEFDDEDWDEESELDDDSAEDDNEDPFDEVMEVGDELQRELDIDASNEHLLDGSNDSASLFDPVEQRDDLKQIFGIGPVTEKALNELGITSYSQLADLKSHEIEKIASALSIVPGRIERDNWVGNARKQLEEVLEEL